MASRNIKVITKRFVYLIAFIIFIGLATPIHADEQSPSKEASKNLTKIALLIFRENDAVKFFSTRKPIKTLSKEAFSKKVAIMDETLSPSSITSDSNGYTFELVSKDGEDGRYGLRLAKQKKKYADYAYPEELTDLLDIYVATVLKNSGYEVFDFTSDRNKLNGLTMGEIKTKLLESGADHLCIIDYGALSQWSKRILDENPFLYSDGVGVYLVCNIALYNKANNSDEYALAAYGVAPYKVVSGDWYKSGCGVTMKNDILQKISMDGNETGSTAEYFVIDNKAIKKSILTEEQKYINRDGDGATGSVRSLKYSILNLLKN